MLFGLDPAVDPMKREIPLNIIWHMNVALTTCQAEDWKG
jgi:hypothetical protein